MGRGPFLGWEREVSELVCFNLVPAPHLQSILSTYDFSVLFYF